MPLGEAPPMGRWARVSVGEAPPMSKQNRFVVAYRCTVPPKSNPTSPRACPNASTLRHWGGAFWERLDTLQYIQFSFTAFVSKPLGRWARLAFRGVDEFLRNLFEMGDMEGECWDRHGGR